MASPVSPLLPPLPLPLLPTAAPELIHSLFGHWGSKQPWTESVGADRASHPQGLETWPSG